MSALSIETPRLRLRPWRETDRAAFAAMHADPAVMVDAPRPLTREKGDRKFDRYLAAFQRDGFCQWAVETRAGDFLGYAGVTRVGDEHPLGAHAGAGWRLVRRAWGHGYATEATGAAFDDAFRRIGLAEALAYTSPDNARSQAVMARLGMRREPHLDFTADDWTGLVWSARPAHHEIEVRPVRPEDAPELASLLNEIIARGGTTALEEPFAPDELARAMLTGPDVICCFVAADRATGRLLGFQSLERWDGLPDDVGDIATFARVGLTRRGVGASLFAATRAEAGKHGLAAINATIRADNSGGLAFYDRMGFADHGVERAAPLKDGQPVDRISKRYALTGG